MAAAAEAGCGADAGAAGEVGEAFLISREQFGMRFGLARMCRLLAELGDPQEAFPAIHVVGTNGKSTTTLMAGAALRAQHLSTGCFTSPHLLSFCERIELDGEIVGAAEFTRAAGRVRVAVERLDADAAADDRVTQFEAITAIAFKLFAERGVEAAVVEAGLGGRLDATNVLGNSVVQVLTSVGIEHTEYLGDTLERIAREKLAVVRSNAALVCGPLPPVVAPVANAVADERDSPLTELRVEEPAFSGLAGGFLRRNASLALMAAETAFPRLRLGGAFDRPAAIDSIADFARSHGAVGRLQIVNLTPFELRDAAHNAQAAAALVEALPEVAGERPVTLLIAMLADKNTESTLTELLVALPEGGALVCTQSANPRSLPAAELARRARLLAAPGVRVETVTEPIAALGRAREIAGRDGALVVTGSNYLLAGLLRDPSAPAGATL